MVMNKTGLLIFGALAGTLTAVFVGAKRRTDRAHALKDRVEIQDWESASLKSTVPGAQLPEPNEVAKEVTGVPVSGVPVNR